jgi:Asp-tRNA(Asn)/Glu-tRNA(Gln) amidotransferase A subunit family amidase
LRRPEDAGAVLVLADLPDEGARRTRHRSGHHRLRKRRQHLRLPPGGGNGRRVRRAAAQASANIRSLYESLPARDAYEAALERRERLQAAIRSHFEAQGVEAIAFPALLAAAPPLGDNTTIEVGGASLPIRTVVGRNTALGNCAGLASWSFPAGLTAAGCRWVWRSTRRPGNDRRLLSLGVLALERALGPIAAPARAALNRPRTGDVE